MDLGPNWSQIGSQTHQKSMSKTTCKKDGHRELLTVDFLTNLAPTKASGTIKRYNFWSPNRSQIHPKTDSIFDIFFDRLLIDF